MAVETSDCDVKELEKLNLCEIDNKNGKIGKNETDQIEDSVHDAVVKYEENAELVAKQLNLNDRKADLEKTEIVHLKQRLDVLLDQLEKNDRRAP